MTVSKKKLSVTEKQPEILIWNVAVYQYPVYDRDKVIRGLLVHIRIRERFV